MMMGTADEIAKAPEKGPVFMEDLPEEEQAVAVVSFRLINLSSITLLSCLSSAFAIKSTL